MATKRGAKPAPRVVKNPARVAARPKTRPGKSVASARAASRSTETPVSGRVEAAIGLLQKRSSKSVRNGLSRFAIPSDHALGVPVGAIRQIAKQLGVDHDLALALYEEKPYEARMLAVFVADPSRLTAAEMDAWCRAFDNWAICDTACFHLFDRSPHAFARVAAWAKRSAEFEKRAAFALLASLALHHRFATDAAFERCLPLIERAATDPRNFVKKGVSWALRGIGGRGVALHRAALSLAQRLATADDPPSRFIGKEALREFGKPALVKRLATRDAARAALAGSRRERRPSRRASAPRRS